MSNKLDQIVKGAVPNNTSANALAQAAKPSPSQATPSLVRESSTDPIDPTSLLPSSPPQIYLNLLILEASLRAQYLHLLSRRRQNTSALTCLFIWTLYFFYAQCFRPRNDDSGIIGGSQYWVVDTMEKMALTGGAVTAVLFWATGLWERGVRWPRRWVAVTNRGLRNFHCKVVVLRGKWWRESLGQLFCLMVPLAVLWPGFDGGITGVGGGGEFVKVDYTNAEKRQLLRQGHHVTRHMEPVEEDISSGGDVVKLLLLPKPFTPDFRENWEIFRTEYWESENARRNELRKRVRVRQREVAKQQGGWLWWTGWRGWPRFTSRSRSGTPEHAEHRPHSHIHSLQHLREQKERKRRSSMLSQGFGRESSHSRSSSRSSTVTVDGEDKIIKASGTAVDGGRRRKTFRENSISSRPSPLTPAGSRPGTPTTGAVPTGTHSFRESTLKKQASALSTASTESGSTDGGEVKIKSEPGTP